MYFVSNKSRLQALLGLTVVSLLASQASAQDALHLYGPLGLNPAIKEAAIVFAARHDVNLEVGSGPLDAWLGDARQNGDLIYCTGEFIMKDFVRKNQVAVDESTMTRLYLRPSVILVRPDNPKDIRDFPDLLKPGTKIMMVNASGQTGLWENMTGRLQSLQNLVALQKNVAVCAKDEDDAMRSGGSAGTSTPG